MKPIGLTLKDIRHNPFTTKTSGELMTVHLCLGCGSVSCNRIAGDDNTYSIQELLQVSSNLEVATYQMLNHLGISLLSMSENDIVNTVLFGN